MDSDTEFNPKENKDKLNVLPQEELKRREDILKSLPERHKLHEKEKRDKLKKDFTDNISKKDWLKFKNWHNAQNSNCQ